jgi:valyl-tRNA synthetase
MNVPTNKQSDIVIRKGKEFEQIINNSKITIQSLSKIDKIIFTEDDDKPKKSATVIKNNMEIFVPLEGLIDFQVESSRLEKRLGELDRHVSVAKKKLSNDNFVKRAPKEVVNHEKQKLDDMIVEYNLVKQNLDFLS